MIVLNNSGKDTSLMLTLVVYNVENMIILYLLGRTSAGSHNLFNLNVQYKPINSGRYILFIISINILFKYKYTQHDFKTVYFVFKT